MKIVRKNHMKIKVVEEKKNDKINNGFIENNVPLDY